MPETQAEAQAETLADAITGQIATKSDLDEVKLEKGAPLRKREQLVFADMPTRFDG